MMKIFHFVLVVLIAAGVLFAGCTAAPEEQATPTPTPIPTETAAPAATLSAALTLGAMHADMMEAIEEALAYPLLKEPEEKSDFEKKVVDFDALAIVFTGAADAADREELDSILIKKAAVVDSARAMFAYVDSTGTADAGNVTAFEDAVDEFTGLFGPFTKAYFLRVSEAEFGDDNHAQAAIDLLLMHHDILEGVEEAFGYVLLGESVEKDDFEQKMSDFDARAEAFAAVEYLDQPGNEAISAAYAGMIDAKERMTNAAAAMFGGFVDTGAAKKGDLEAFEIAVDVLTTAYEHLMEEVLSKL